jgi:hypothetical protein
MFESYQNTFQGNWKRLIDKWAAMNIEFLALTDELPAWYVENTNTALLAAAAWSCGFAAVCELDTKKQRRTGKRGEPTQIDGRVDIVLKMDNTTTWVEAKKLNFDLSKVSESRGEIGRLNRSLQSAWREALNCQSDANEYGASIGALTFFSGTLSPEYFGRGKRHSKRRDLITGRLKSWNDSFESTQLDKQVGTVKSAAYFSDAHDLPVSKDNYRPVVFGLYGTSPTK